VPIGKTKPLSLFTRKIEGLDVELAADPERPGIGTVRSAPKDAGRSRAVRPKADIGENSKNV
jgi:hypothetical protein